MLAFIFVALLATYLVFRPKSKGSGLTLPDQFPAEWKTFLRANVNFYAALSPEKQALFEADIVHFLKRVRITGVKTEVTDHDRLLVASSAIIPVFSFPEWEYKTLHEVLLYPDLFNQDFSLSDEQRNVSGMVGSGGVMDNIVIFSKPALWQGFDNAADKQNVGIHEFVHLLDKQDGSIDGIPEIFVKNQATLPWVNLMQTNMQKIAAGKSDIRPYGATNLQEFLAVASEYFFERPALFKKKHPDLYAALSEVFKYQTDENLDGDERVKRTLNRNDACPCGSGKKYKKCCMPHN